MPMLKRKKMPARVEYIPTSSSCHERCIERSHLQSNS